MARYIFITGGVVSSLVKGPAAAALAKFLQARGYKVRLHKLDPYLNIDPATMSPYQHGEIFVTDDGAVADVQARPDLVDQQRGTFDHATGAAAGAKAPPFTAEGHQALAVAILAPAPPETVFQNAALEEIPQTRVGRSPAACGPGRLAAL
jgi:hypothetical protein